MGPASPDIFFFSYRIQVELVLTILGYGSLHYRTAGVQQTARIRPTAAPAWPICFFGGSHIIVPKNNIIIRLHASPQNLPTKNCEPVFPPLFFFGVSDENFLPFAGLIHSI
jgi:hypothetical protein